MIPLDVGTNPFLSMIPHTGSASSIPICLVPLLLVRDVYCKEQPIYEASRVGINTCVAFCVILLVALILGIANIAESSNTKY